MAGETQRRYAVKELDAESKLQDEGTALEQFTEKTTKESSEHFTSAGTETRTVSRVTTFVEKERDYTQQREAVIRPQQAGKIDFKSLQNRPKFSSDRTWPGGKGSPQSPTGKNRNRDKGKRSGKSERGNPQQLYRLSITNPRANPTIGIAYPQQKVSPPKKLEASRGPVSGSYRFHVPSIPEREAELQQEELNFSRCFQETSSNLTTPSYTSQALGSTGVTSTHHPPLSQQQQQQQPGPMENNNTQPGSQLLFPDFQMSASNSWQSPERTFNGANYGISSQKSTVLPETNKANGSFVPLPFQYGYQLLEDSTPDPFPCDQNPQPQDYIDSSLAPGQVTHNSFSFQTSGEGQDVVQNNTQFNNEQSEDRSSYSHPPQPPQYLQAPQGASSSMHCPRGLNEDSASSESSGSSSQQSEQSKSALPESTEAFGQQDNRDAALASGSKTSCHPKDGAANQRTRVQGSVHHARNIAQGPSSQMHFPNKAYNSPPLNNIHMGSVPFDKSINNKVHSRLPQSWEGASKAFSPVEQNAMPYPNMNDKFQFQSQPALDQRPNTSKSSRMPWQQIRLTSAIPNQNRIELSRQLSNQKMTYLVSPSDWQEDSKSHKNGSLKSPNSFQNNRISEGFSNPRQDSVKQSCSTISSFKVETSHAQVCDSKNKPIYFGLNQSLPGASSRTYGYPPLQVPPMGLMMVSPYESPLPSPVHNPNSSSTCSSLSPASTSPVNLSSEDSQITKAGPPPPFYHQHQVKAQAPTDHLSTNPHLFHSDNSRNLPYAPERAKDDMMSYLQNNGHPKTSMDGNKGYMDSFGVDHHPPPPPYSAHQLLATSLATANLDQLDVLLTCKQCDQNFTNLASFLGHKQYCGQHAFAQNDFKDMSKVEDTRKFHTDMSKATSSSTNLCQGVSMPRLPSDLHLSLLGLNKNGELMSDSETKGDSKEDPMKLNLFAGANNLPVSLPDLEMEDAKLDSLITEALNGLGYQSDNAEIDSSFIDAFADDDLTTVKVTSNRQTLKTKDFMVFESKSKQATDDDSSLIQGKYLYDSDIESLETDNKHTENKLEKTPLNLKQDEKINIKKEVSHKNSRMASGEKSREQENKVKQAIKLCKSEDETTNAPRFLLSSKFSERCGVKSYQDSSLRGSTPSQASTVNTSSTSPRIAARESKRKRTGAGTWSKELIHKIVQQKNKLHKLSVKGTKNLQFSLVMERLTPTVQNPTFGEYDYVSDSDDECEPVKIASQGRLSQSNRCKYTYTKECKWRARSERDRAAWRHESKECFEVKKAEDISLSPEKHGSHQRLVRRGSRSSTSSELSTSVSISSDSINSPKSTDHTDSDCEKKMETRRKDSPEQKTYERSPQKICKESSTHLSLTFTKSTKRYNGYQTLLSANKDNSVASKIHNSNYDDPITALPKVRGPVKKLEKCRNTDVSSREKEGSCSREIILTASSAKITPLRIDIKTPKGESIHLHPINTDLKLHQLESHPAANNNKETSSHKNNETISKGKSVHKRRESGGSQAIPPKSKLSEMSTFEKQSDSIYPLKEPINLVNKLVPKTTTLCSGLMNEVCLSPTELQEPLTQKETCHLIPYPLEQDQSLMKSPLSFDTSSMFGDLTVAGFDNGLYTDIPLHKDGFNSLEPTSDKKEVFGSSFSPFLEQRDWGLMVDVSPMLPDEISQYKDDSDRSNEKKSDYNHVPLSLPDKIMDYSANLSSCVSEDELEIKRIVTELENQLQTAKMSSPQLLTENSPKQLKMSKFSPLRLDNESDSEDTGLDIGCPVQSMAMAVSSMPSEPFTEPGLPWSSPFQFELMDGHQSPHTPTHTEPGVLEHLTENEDDAHSIITTASNAEKEQLHQEDHKLEETDDDKRTAIEKSEEILESKMYAENLMKSLEVISDSIFRKDPVTPDLEELNIAALNSPEQLHGECQATTAAEDKDHSEKDVIPNEENFESIMNETQPLLSEDTDITSDAKQAISLLSSESVENHNNTSEPKEISMVEDITEVSSMIEGAYCSNMEVDNPQVTEETCDIHNMEDCGDKIHNDIGDQPELSDLLDAPIDDHKEIGPVEDINLSTLPVSPPSVVSNLAEQKMDDDFDNKLDAIENACEERPIEIQNNPEVGCCSPSTEELKEGNSACMKEEGMIESNTTTQVGLISHIAPPTCSTPENDVANQTTHISMEKVTDKPYSPLLMETNTEHARHSSPFANIETTDGESTMLVLEEPDNLLSNDAHISTPEDKATTEIDPECQTIQKEREEIPNVEDIHEQVPTDLMATAQISICREDLQINDSQGLTLEAAPPSTPFQPISPHTPTESAVMQEEQGQSQSILQDIQSPREESCDDLNAKEALHNDEPLGITAEMEYSLISPPQLDLGITESKISSTEASIPSVLPLTNITEPSDVLDALPKSGTLYNFKLSPLNYNDEPPQLNQYDYIPISPVNSGVEEEPTNKQSPRDDCEPCDLSHDTAPMSNKTMTDIDTELPMSPEHSARLSQLDESLGNNSIENNLQFPGIPLGFPSKCSSPSTDNIKEDLDICPTPLATIDYLDLHVDLLKRVDPEILDIHEVPCEQDVPPSIEDISDDQHTPKPLIICENESTIPLPCPSPSPSNKPEPQIAVEAQYSQKLEEDTFQKKTSSQTHITQQGKVVCEICSMCFRTVPGLKRHKAMKHLVRTDRGPLENAPSIHTYQPSQCIDTAHKGDIGLQDIQACLQTGNNGISENHCPQIINNSLTAKQGETDLVLEDTASETTMTMTSDEIGQKMPPLLTKVKRSYKARKTKSTEMNIKPDPFSDELLNILKTDILQAITPEFQTRVQQGSCKSPERQEEMNSHVNHNVTEEREVPFTIAVNSGIEDVSASETEETNVLSQTMDVNQSKIDTEEVKVTILPEIDNGVTEVSTDVSMDYGVSVSKDISREYDESRDISEDMKEMCEQQTSDESLATDIMGEVAVEIKCEKNCSPTDEVDPLSCFKSPPASPPGLSPDLKAFLDDESTFSQLFPRDEEMKRKKCARVYGKRNKRQKLSPDSPIAQEYPSLDIFPEKKDQYTENEHCEYETISIDDAIMLNMCHNSTLKSDAKKVVDMKGDINHQDIHDNTEELGSDLLCPTESTIDKASIAWSGSNNLNSIVTDTLISPDPSSCKAEVSTTPCPIIASSAPYPEEPCGTDNVPPFHSIDIQNPNTTFQLPEIQFFDSNKDISVAGLIVPDDMEIKEIAKPKKPTERRGRKRQDGSIKIKDKQYKCKVCFTWFLTLGELNFHKLSHNPSPPPTCYMCVQRKFSSREQLRDHLREKHAKNKAGIWTCGMCLKEISDVWMYNEHLREHATQFARKGQTQSSMLGMPGCFMQETAVKNFITSIMQRRPSKANRESSKVAGKEQGKVATETTKQEAKTTEGPEPKVIKTKSSCGGSVKQNTLTPVEVLHKTETAPKNMEMHPNCKDPSRDCHHCGKQFPKPFKLQRHLVVHNLHKIFLCHKCPVSYQEPQELKDHLKSEHEEVDELDSKHTTLYTCELCADVMHVIKKSFICSTCNYTFSKKEQFDRHMEKHLSGGNKIFKFRGVLRPIKASASKDEECDLPTSKKRKILTESLQENSSDSGIASIASMHLNQSTEMQALKPTIPTTEDSTQTSAAEYNTDTNDASVKTEDIAEDYSDILGELKHCSFHMGSSECESLSTATPKTEDIDPGHSLKLPIRDICEGDDKSFTEPCDVKEEDDSLCNREETMSQWLAPKENGAAEEEGSIQIITVEAEEKRMERRDSTTSNEELYIRVHENMINSSKTPDSHHGHDLHHPSTKHKTSAIVMDQMREDEQGQHSTSNYNNDNKQKDLFSPNGSEQQCSSQAKDKASPTKPSESTKHNSTNCPRVIESMPVFHTKLTSMGSTPSEDKDSVRQQKKRKEMKSPNSLQRVSSPATRENLGIDARTKKKFRPSKCESPSVHRKSDGPSDYPVLSSVRDDVVSNKIVSKHKTGSLGLQPKRTSLDNCTPKKAEILHHLNGDYKAKKGPPGRPLHFPVSKVSTPPMNNSLSKSRPKTGVRSMETHAYRTAESQNNLLSQLFGQKLTSFKIPLRKDTSESIN